MAMMTFAADGGGYDASPRQGRRLNNNNNTLRKKLRQLAILAWIVICGQIWFAYLDDDDSYVDNHSPRLLLHEGGSAYSFADGYHLLSSEATTPPDRMLQEQEEEGASTALTPKNQTKLIKDTCTLYLSIFCVLFVIFLFVRPLFPRVYNFKKSSTKFDVPVANDSFGSISWLWKVFNIPDDDMREQCGMDALTTLRVMQTGVKLSLVGVFNSVFLFPIYSMFGNGSRPNDLIYSLSLSDMGKNNSGVYATAVAAYILFGAAMCFIVLDFKWFTAHRHAFLSKKSAQNLSVYLSGLPPEMQTNKAVSTFFGKSFSCDAVAEAHVALITPQLDKKVAERDALIPKLEHGINVVNVKHTQPSHKTKKIGGEKVESVPFWSQEIKDLNGEIELRRHSIESVRLGMEDSSIGVDIDNVKQPLQVDSKEDGAPRSAAFVTFFDLTSANLARQRIQYPKPWSVVPIEPPVPDCVNWGNIGTSNKMKQGGEVLSLMLTILLCIFWTIPVAFVQSISNVEGLTGLLPFLKEPVEKYAWLSEALSILAPLLLVIFLSLLPKILLAFVKFELGIEIETFKHPSLFVKLAAFSIIQTFFISTIASTLFSSIQGIIEDPASGITLLSEALPAQAAFFIQLIIVQSLVPLGIELLRIVPIVMNLIRKMLAKLLGHNLSEKERNEMFILPSLNDPAEYFFGTETGTKIVVLTMVQYVYSCMSPITSFFTLLVFSFLTVGLRNQFLFIYPPINDSGGKLWLNLQRLSVVYMIIAEVILFVLMLSKNFIAAMLLIPLIVVTILFKFYTGRKSYSDSVINHLPIEMSAAIDDACKQQRAIDDSLKNAYLQPSLRAVSLLPENYHLINAEIGQKDNVSEVDKASLSSR